MFGGASESVPTRQHARRAEAQRADVHRAERLDASCRVVVVLAHAMRLGQVFRQDARTIQAGWSALVHSGRGRGWCGEHQAAHASVLSRPARAVLRRASRAASPTHSSPPTVSSSRRVGLFSERDRRLAAGRVGRGGHSNWAGNLDLWRFGRGEHSAPKKFGQHHLGHSIRAADAGGPRAFRVMAVNRGGLFFVERQHVFAAVLVGRPERAGDELLRCAERGVQSRSRHTRR